MMTTDELIRQVESGEVPAHLRTLVASLIRGKARQIDIALYCQQLINAGYPKRCEPPNGTYYLAAKRWFMSPSGVSNLYSRFRDQL